jgi:hypothetical protein
MAAFVILSSCERRQQDAELKDIKKTVDFLFTQSMSVQGQLTSLEQPSYLLHDMEQRKIIGILHKTPPLQVGNVIVWDDDVYQVEAIRLLSQKRGEEKVGETTLKRTADIEVFVKFVSKVIPSDKNP